MNCTLTINKGPFARTIDGRNRNHAHDPANCPSNHYNDGTDHCADCGADLHGEF
jgi:hypothetical protein